jgi:hypothetical protein
VDGEGACVLMFVENDDLFGAASPFHKYGTSYQRCASIHVPQNERCVPKVDSVV